MPHPSTSIIETLFNLFDDQSVFFVQNSGRYPDLYKDLIKDLERGFYIHVTIYQSCVGWDYRILNKKAYMDYCKSGGTKLYYCL